jgi:hypothetical protein
MLIPEMGELFIRLYELVGDVLGIDGVAALRDCTADLCHARGVHLGSIPNRLLEAGELSGGPRDLDALVAAGGRARALGTTRRRTLGTLRTTAGA